MPVVSAQIKSDTYTTCSLQLWEPTISPEKIRKRSLLQTFETYLNKLQAYIISQQSYADSTALLLCHYC